MRSRGHRVGAPRRARPFGQILGRMCLGRAACLALAAAILLFGSVVPVGAESRTWTDVTGKFRIEAELVRVDGDQVVLQPQAGGKPRTVSRAKLSPADQAYLDKFLQQPPPAEPEIKALPDEVAKVERQARRCRSAEEALSLYQLFLADRQVPKSLKEAAAPAVRYWQGLAREGRLRVGNEWLPPAEVEAIRAESDELVRQGMELLKTGSIDQAVERLRKASQLDPDSYLADAASGTFYFYLRDFDAAEKHYQRCRTRAPDQGWIANNLAICQLLVGKMDAAAKNLSAAASLLPREPGVRNNLAKLLRLGEVAKDDPRLRSLKISRGALRVAADAYSQLPSDDGGAVDLKADWVIVFPAGDELPDSAGNALQLTGSGSGFVVAPGYVVTNRHVIDGAERVAVVNPKNPEGTPLGATIVAASDEVDLAILHVPELTCYSLPLATTDVVRGLEIMLLGYPLGTGLGAGLKSTRGAIVALPDAALEGMFLHDCTTNPGNSGGPVCDNTGTVVGVCTAMTVRLAGQYGMAVPSSAVVSFCREKIPHFEPVGQAINAGDWTEVDRRVSPSTVMVVTVGREGER